MTEEKKLVFINIVDGSPADYSQLCSVLSKLQQTSNYKFIAAPKQLKSFDKEDFDNMLEGFGYVKNDNRQTDRQT